MMRRCTQLQHSIFRSLYRCGHLIRCGVDRQSDGDTFVAGRYRQLALHFELLGASCSVEASAWRLLCSLLKKLCPLATDFTAINERFEPAHKDRVWFLLVAVYHVQ